MGTLGICPICGKREELTKHHIKELGRDEDGSIKKIGLCDPCHVWHEKYINALKSFGYDPDRT